MPLIPKDELQEIRNAVTNIDAKIQNLTQQIENLNEIVNIQLNIVDECMTLSKAATFIGLKAVQLMRSDCPRHVHRDPQTGKENVYFMRSEIIKFIKQQ